jgi:hypothetical protein
MRKLVQIAIIFAVVVPLLFLAPTIHSETLRGEGSRTNLGSWKEFDAIECSLVYSVLQVGLNHRYTYLAFSNGSEIVTWDWGWRLDSSMTVSTKPPRHGVVNGTGTIEYVTFLGFYGIVGDDGETYDPLSSLPQEFAVDGLRVSFSVRICEDCASVTMWGYVVEVIFIARL